MKFITMLIDLMTFSVVQQSARDILTGGHRLFVLSYSMQSDSELDENGKPKWVSVSLEELDVNKQCTVWCPYVRNGQLDWEKISP